MNIRYQVGRLAEKCGYKIVSHYKYPEVHGNLLEIGLSLLRARTGGRIHIVQVGAFDGALADPLEGLLQDERVCAVLVEPQIAPYKLLEKKYASNQRVRLVNSAVATNGCDSVMYVPGPDASPKASLEPLHHRRFGIKSSSVREIQVKCVSVAFLLKSCSVDRVNVLQLDTEGMDFQILNWFFEAGQEPDVIGLESLHLSKRERLASRELLSRAYYWIETGQDTVAIKQSLIRDV